GLLAKLPPPDPGQTSKRIQHYTCWNVVETFESDRLHFVVTGIIDKALRPVILLRRRVFSDRGAGILDDLIVNIDRTVDTKSQGDRVTRPGIDDEHLTG